MTRSLKISRAPADNDPQWGSNQIGVREAWKRLAEAKREPVGPEDPIVVAIVDWGIQRNHEAFDQVPGMISGARVIPPENDDFSDDDGHGTMLAGTIDAIVNHDLGGRRKVPLAQLKAIKFVDVRTPPMSKYAAGAINHAVDDGAKIINASWEVGVDNPELRKAIERARINRVLVVVAAGNNGNNSSRYPGFPASYDFDNMITVMATDVRDNKAGFSNYGKNVHIAAPGVNIVSSFPYLSKPAYRSYSGTSPAAAHVSGAAALLLSINRDLKPSEIRDYLVASANRVENLERYNIGRLNLDLAVNMLLQEIA